MKHLFGILISLLGLFLVGCGAHPTTTAPYEYVVFQDRDYILSQTGPYCFGDQCITIDDTSFYTVITASFLEGTVTVSGGGSTVLVQYPDGCVERYETTGGSTVQTRFATSGHDHLSASHLALSRVTVLLSVDNSADPVYLSGARIGLIVFGFVGTVVTGLFVFRPKKTEKLILLSNRVVPLYKEPVQPTDLHLVFRYLGILSAFLLSLAVLLYGLFS